MAWKDEMLDSIYDGILWQSTYQEELSDSILRVYAGVSIITTWITGLTAGWAASEEDWMTVQIVAGLAILHGLFGTFLVASGLREVPEKLSDLGRRIDVLMVNIYDSAIEAPEAKMAHLSLKRDFKDIKRAVLIPFVFCFLIPGARKRAVERLEDGYAWD